MCLLHPERQQWSIEEIACLTVEPGGSTLRQPLQLPPSEIHEYSPRLVVGPAEADRPPTEGEVRMLECLDACALAGRDDLQMYQRVLLCYEWCRAACAPLPVMV